MNQRDVLLKTPHHETTPRPAWLVGQKGAQAYRERGADVITLVDPMTSQISPEHFEQFVSPVANQMFDFVRDRRGLSSLFVCGDATRNPGRHVPNGLRQHLHQREHRSE